MEERAPKNNVAEGKPDLSEIPMDLMGYAAKAWEYGSKVKYSRNSWRKGFLMNESVRALRSHLSDFWENGEDYDQDAASKGVAMHHLGSIIFNACCLLDAFVNHPELDNRWKKPEVRRLLAEQTEFLKNHGFGIEIVIGSGEVTPTIDGSTIIPGYIESIRANSFEDYVKSFNIIHQNDKEGVAMVDTSSVFVENKLTKENKE